MDYIVNSNAMKILSKLNSFGYEAYIVGGCVRDLIRGVNPNDWDICTNASPDKVQGCFKGYKIIETGLKHGTVTIVLDGESFEVTTYRIDGIYEDGRRPKSVIFTSNLKEDLSRRDFTINAIAMDLDGNIIDPFNGKFDIENKIIRCVGDPDKRFKEDGLRILRALRFSSSLDYKIENETYKSLKKNKEMLDNIAIERVNSEISKILCGDNVKNVLQENYDIFKFYFSDFLDMNDAWDCATKVVSFAPKDFASQIATMIVLGGSIYVGMTHSESDLFDILEKYKFSNCIENDIVNICSWFNSDKGTTYSYIKRLLNEYGERTLRKIFDVYKGIEIFMGNDLEYVSDAYINALNQVIENDGCYQLSQLEIDGNDIIECGIEDYSNIGIILDRILFDVIDEKVENSKNELLKLANKYVKELE